MSRRWDLDAAIVQLGQEFRRRGMTSHLQDLRSLWRRRNPAQGRRARGFDEGLVVEWLCLLRMPPFENVYPVQARGDPCPKCGAKEERAAPSSFVLASFTGGSLHECRQCKSCWLTYRDWEPAEGQGSGR